MNWRFLMPKHYIHILSNTHWDREWYMSHEKYLVRLVNLMDRLMDIMKDHYSEGGTVAAICAAPSVVLSLLPNIEGKKMTCYDGFEQALADKGAEYVKEGVVVDGNMITGRGPGWAQDFGLTILAHVKGQEIADKVKAGLML